MSVKRGEVFLAFGIVLVVIGAFCAISGSALAYRSPDANPNTMAEVSPRFSQQYLTGIGFQNLATEPPPIIPVTGVEEVYTSIADPSVSSSSSSQPMRQERGSLAKGIPVRVVIPAISLDAPVVRSGLQTVMQSGYLFEQWSSPEYFAVGWHITSALLGKSGNTVFNGHNNSFGEVFRSLDKLSSGNIIYVFSEEEVFQYAIANKLILSERNETLNQRIENARWISQSNDERLTLVTCWPYETNTHRLIIVATRIK